MNSRGFNQLQIFVHKQILHSRIFHSSKMVLFVLDKLVDAKLSAVNMIFLEDDHQQTISDIK